MTDVNGAALDPRPLTPRAVLWTSIALVAVTAVAPWFGIVSGPLLLYLGARGRRHAGMGDSERIPFKVAFLAGALISLAAVTAVALAMVLVAVPQGNLGSPVPLAVP